MLLKLASIIDRDSQPYSRRVHSLAHYGSETLGTAQTFRARIRLLTQPE